MLLRVNCAKTDIEQYEDYYTSNGFYLVDKMYEGDIVELTFKAVSSAHSAVFLATDPSARAFLEFSDGTTSPLYVRRTHSFDD